MKEIRKKRIKLTSQKDYHQKKKKKKKKKNT
jgi:hypothetical protein